MTITLGSASIQELEAEIERRNKPKMLECPLCTSAIESPRNKGISYTDNSGNYYEPSIWCNCGFSLTPPTKGTCSGTDGWDAMRKDADKAYDIIERVLAKDES